ncbi:hypothetical protein ACEQ8H_001487 [Pleosporales sp. CAS-2024a]
MAVLDSVPGLEVQIVVHDEALQEYQDRLSANVAEKSVESYVEAQSGARFQIRYHFTPPFPADRPLSAHVTIDGQYLDAGIIWPFELFNHQGHMSRGTLSQVGQHWMLQPYLFAPIKITKDTSFNTSEASKARLKKTGVITCEFRFIDKVGKKLPKHCTNKNMPKLPPLSEKEMKGNALSHQAILGKHEPDHGTKYHHVDYADKGVPFATFHFYYRSNAALKDLHIIERTPDPVDLPVSDDTPVGQLSREQLQGILYRLEERDATPKRLKLDPSSETTIGNDNKVAGGVQRQDPDPTFIKSRSNELRAERKRKRARQLPTPEIEVIELD